MKLALLVLSILLGLLSFTQAVKTQKSFVVTYPHDTPDSVLNQAKQAITDAGGVITHEYQLIKGFAAKASANVIESVSTLSAAYNPFIEEDKVVTADGDFVGEDHVF
ncbi:hypothetical protein VTN00DRAFT_8579 [Thermoascus crustaceus]|uniref:uncharacterized protein n=1 Tax=Thermoascus crustaceus TaxID=5088 RepID=UPI003742B480